MTFFSSFADYGTLLYIRGLIYTQDGRSIVDTVGQRRFRVVSRDVRDGYDTARIQLIRDHRIEDETEFNGLFIRLTLTFFLNDFLFLIHFRIVSNESNYVRTCSSLVQSIGSFPTNFDQSSVRKLSCVR